MNAPAPRSKKAAKNKVGKRLGSLGVDVSPNRAPIKPLARLAPKLRNAGMQII